MRWRWPWQREHRPHEVDDVEAAARAAAEAERKLQEARREAARRRPEIREARDTFAWLVEQAMRGHR